MHNVALQRKVDRLMELRLDDGKAYEVFYF